MERPLSSVPDTIPHSNADPKTARSMTSPSRSDSTSSTRGLGAHRSGPWEAFKKAGVGAFSSVQRILQELRVLRGGTRLPSIAREATGPLHRPCPQVVPKKERERIFLSQPRPLIGGVLGSIGLRVPFYAAAGFTRKYRRRLPANAVPRPCHGAWHIILLLLISQRQPPARKFPNLHWPCRCSRQRRRGKGFSAAAGLQSLSSPSPSSS